MLVHITLLSCDYHVMQVLTPRMARLSLSSVALRDGIVHGLPITGQSYYSLQYLYCCVRTCTSVLAAM